MGIWRPFSTSNEVHEKEKLCPQNSLIIKGKWKKRLLQRWDVSNENNFDQNFPLDLAKSGISFIRSYFK